MMKMTIELLHQQLLQKKTSPIKIVRDAIAKAKKYEHYNGVVKLLEEEAMVIAKHLESMPIPEDNYLFAIPYAVKDNLATKNIVTSGGTKILENFVPTFDSKVVKDINDYQAVNIAKATLDELGMGGIGLDSFTGFVYNPWNKNHITGGSSSGSAALVALGVVPFALASDTGDSIRKPASYTGIVGIKPTYGLISRYGLFPYAPSLDTVGVLANTVRDCAIVMDATVKFDANDLTSQQAKEKDYLQNLSLDIKKYRLATIKSVNDGLRPLTGVLWSSVISKLKEQGLLIEDIDFPLDLLKALLPVYMVISFAEATSSQSNLTAINFGKRISKDDDSYQNIMIKSRSVLGKTVKRRYVIGAYALAQANQQELFLQAKKVRRKIVDHFEKIFTDYDGLLLPAAGGDAPTIEKTINHKLELSDVNNLTNDALLLANFSGAPSITIPIGLVNELPFGMTINCLPFADQKALNIAYGIEKIINFENSCHHRKEK